MGRDNSFTVKLIPHDATRNGKEWIVTGNKLLVFRIVMVLLFIVFAGSIVVVSVGMSEFTRTADLKLQNELLLDSLTQSRNSNKRLDAIELELQEIQRTRMIIENLATAGGS